MLQKIVEQLTRHKIKYFFLSSNTHPHSFIMLDVYIFNSLLTLHYIHFLYGSLFLLNYVILN